jgi:serine/threonine-protein kinase RsbW
VETRTPHVARAPVTVRVPFAASSVAVARQQLRAWLRSQGCAREVIEDGRVIISELVGNSVRHAKPLSDGTILITWARDRRGIRISVTDGGSTSRPRKMNASASAVSGRGMAIVDALALDWWAEQSRTRSTIHALLRA